MKRVIKEYLNIEKEFFDIDDENNLANIKLNHNKPTDIFDGNFQKKRVC